MMKAEVTSSVWRFELYFSTLNSILLTLCLYHPETKIKCLVYVRILVWMPENTESFPLACQPGLHMCQLRICPHQSLLCRIAKEAQSPILDPRVIGPLDFNSAKCYPYHHSFYPQKGEGANEIRRPELFLKSKSPNNLALYVNTQAGNT